MKIIKPTEQQSEEQKIVEYVNNYLDGTIDVVSMLPKGYIKRSNPYEGAQKTAIKKKTVQKLELA